MDEVSFVSAVDRIAELVDQHGIGIYASDEFTPSEASTATEALRRRGVTVAVLSASQVNVNYNDDAQPEG